MVRAVGLSMVLAGIAENSGNPELTARGVDQGVTATQPGGNMEGKDVRFGPSTCGLWVGSTTGTSNGSVNCMHDSLTPLGGGVPLFSMMLGEMTPGGVGVGLMGLLVYALLAVFIAGLMVGRTPEYLGKKIQAPEMKLVVIYLIAMPLAVLGLAAIAVRLPHGARRVDPEPRTPTACPRSCTATPRPANNNGSAFAGLTALDVVDGDQPGHRHADRSVRADHPRPRGRRFARPQAAGARDRRHLPDDLTALRRPARWGAS